MLACCYRLCLIFILSLTTREASARWSHHDADELDRLTQLGSEYYNDILSYRDPGLWDELWQATNLGFRTSAGSLNKKELFYQRQIKLRTSKSEAWQLAYTSELQEETKQIEEDSGLELSYGPEQQSWRLGLLGDGSTEKSYADIGMNISWAAAENFYYQIVYWSVDPFYTEKKLETADFRRRNPRTVELNARHKWGLLSMSLRHLDDGAVAWQRNTRDQSYSASQQKTSWLSEYSAPENRQFYASLQQQRSREGLFTLSQNLGAAYLHQEYTAEFGFKQQLGKETMLWAIWGLTSRTQVHQVEWQDDQIQSFDRSLGRDEAAILWNRSFSLGEGEHRQELGFTINQVRLRKITSERSTEVKFNWGPDWKISSQGRIKINSTWDIDQLVRDFPFQKKGFHPWGGGQASFLVHF